MSEKICSATYDDINGRRSSSITFTTVQIQGEEAQNGLKKQDHAEGNMGHGHG